MTMMLHPDLLDRRALALFRLTDAYGRAVADQIAFVGDGAAVAGKGDGRFALIAAAGLGDYVKSFVAPGAPAVGALTATIDITPLGPGLAPRRITVKLPRDPDPAHAATAASLFQPIAVDILPAATAAMTGGAGAVRATVVRDDDGRRVEGALVRVRSDDGRFNGRAITDAAGEACVILPALPLSFPGAGANVVPDLAAHVVADADPATALFHTDAGVAPARHAAAVRRTGHVDPDAFAAATPADFAAGTAIRIGAGRQPTVTLQWHAP